MMLPFVYPRVARPSLRTHLLPRLFFLHACATRATLKPMVLLPPTHLRPHVPRLHRRRHLHPPLLGPPLHTAHGLSQPTATGPLTRHRLQRRSRWLYRGLGRVRARRSQVQGRVQGQFHRSWCVSIYLTPGRLV